jgi:hypothetical protein
MIRRRKRRLPFAAYAALLFNASICVAPFIGARAVSTAYGSAPEPQFEATNASLAATSQAIDGRLKRLTTSVEGEPRDVWAGYIRNELEAGDMTTVDGFMLAAPAMLGGGPDGESLKARIAVSNGSGDAALINAALAYLPEDVQDAYERRSASIVSMFDNAAPAAAVSGASASPAGSATAADATTPAAAADDAGDRVQFHVLGDLHDMAVQAAAWARDEHINEFAFMLAGVGLVMADSDAAEGASIALSAQRAGRLDDAFQKYLERKLFLAAPPQRIKRLLAGEFQNDYGYLTSGPSVVENVFKSSVDHEALESLFSDLRIMREIARDTSPVAAVAILSEVRDGSDLRRASLVAKAGGNRAVALARYDGEHLLDTARVAVPWTNALRLQLAGLGACMLLLIFVAMNVLWKSFTRDRPKRRSAVYALDEIPDAA